MVHACPQTPVNTPEWALDYPRVSGSTLIERPAPFRKVPATQKTAVNAMRTVETSNEKSILMTSGHLEMKYLHSRPDESGSIDKIAELFNEIAKRVIVNCSVWF